VVQGERKTLKMKAIHSAVNRIHRTSKQARERERERERETKEAQINQHNEIHSTLNRILSTSLSTIFTTFHNKQQQTAFTTHII
jgi:hypothetical protein